LNNILRAVKADLSGNQPCEIIDDESLLADKFSSLQSDESKLQGGALGALARPKSHLECSTALSLFASSGKQIAIVTGGTGLSGGAVPLAGAQMISLAGMKDISALGFDPDKGHHFVRVQAGVTLAELNEHLGELEEKVFFPVDPTETSASLAGMVATNASGARSFFYGSIRNWVRWIRVVLSDGSILELTRDEFRIIDGQIILEIGDEQRELKLEGISIPETKHTLGYRYRDDSDPIDIFIGSEGTLGVITDVELQLEPVPTQRMYFLQFFNSESSALSFVCDLRKEEKLKTLAIEFCDRKSLDFVLQSSVRSDCKAAGLIKDSHKAAVYCEFICETEEELLTLYERLETVLEKNGSRIEDSFAGTEDKDLRDMKMFRHAVPETINSLIARRRSEIPGLHKIATDMSVPDEAIQTVFDLYRGHLDSRNLEYAIFGHAGDNHFHVNILPRTEEELRVAKEAYKEIAAKVVSLRGAVSAEHGIGRIKKAFLLEQFGADEIDKMKKIRSFFDPDLRLSTGVLFD
jgi:D-lactate dehydrogenase (cytochrome)